MWRARERDLLEAEAWIVDGNYGSTMEERLERADTLVFLDLPRVLCTWRVLKRVLSYRPGARPDMAPGCHERFDWEFLRWVWRYLEEGRPKVLKALEAHRARLNVVHLKSEGEVKRFLAGVDSS